MEQQLFFDHETAPREAHELELAMAGLHAATFAGHGGAAASMWLARRAREHGRPRRDFPAMVQPMLALRRRYTQWRTLRALQRELGVDLPIDAELTDAMLAEVRRHQWLEAERAGRDIWRERNPSNPESAALRDWFRRYFGAWYLHHARTLQPS